MENKKDISKLIQDSQEKLNRKPSDLAWNKLDEQLEDFRPKAKRRQLFAKISIAASVIAIIGIGSLVSSNLQKKNNQTAMNAPIEMTFEELSHDDYSSVNIAQKETYRSAQQTAQVKEGSADKKLRPTAKLVENVISKSKPITAVTPELKSLPAAKMEVIEHELPQLASADMAMDDVSAAGQKHDVAKRSTSTVVDASKAKKMKKPAYVLSSSLNTFKWIIGDWREIAGSSSAWNLGSDNVLKNEEFEISLSGDKIYIKVPFENYEGKYTLISSASNYYVFAKNNVTISIRKDQANAFDISLNDNGYKIKTMRSYRK